MPLENEAEDFICKIFTSVNEEVVKLDEGQSLVVTTEIVESVFGSYKPSQI